MRDLAHLAEIQAARAAQKPPLRHQTRNMPKRAAEIIEGGSIYWVVSRILLVRQRITAIISDTWDDGSRCAGLVLDPNLVQVTPRAMKPFQGWRYLAHADAPLDLCAPNAASGIDALPPNMRLALTHLALL